MITSAWANEETNCVFPNHKQSPEELNKLTPLMRKSFTVYDSESKYKYIIGICENAINVPTLSNGPDVSGVAVAQFVKNGTSNKWTYVAAVGKYTDCAIMGGSDWVLLTYGSGKHYSTHCTNEARQAMLMFTCDESVPVDTPEIIVVGENTDKVSDCYYLFEIGTSVVCQTKPVVTFGLSFGSIIVIVFFSVALLYLILGVVYNRFVLSAKGLEQIPNYSFWQDFGNLQSDGCNLVCRSGGRSQPRSYKGIGDDQLVEEEERDDHLLPM
ncbi:hypothetical protein ScPMuIL_009576 [Solemya velum]